MMQTCLGNVRYAFRQFAKAPGFTVTVLLTLALGIGGSTSIFSCVYSLLLKGLPFADAGRVVTIADTHPQLKGTIGASFPEYLDWRTQQTSFSEMAAYADRDTAVLSFDGRSEQVHQVLASGGFFPLLGTSANLGRLLRTQDDRDGSDRVAVLSSTAWQRYFGNDPHVIGRSVELNAESFTIVGVLPSGAAFPAEADVWLPLSLLDKENQSSRVYHSVNVLGRLRAGVTLQEAQTQMQTISQRLALAYPATNRKFGVRLEGLREKLVGPIRPALFSVMGAVMLLLIVACANVANLFLVRAKAQQREIVIRQSLGADRRRLFSQFFTQSMVLSLAGGVLGSMASLGSIPLLKVALARTGNLDPQLVHSISLSVPVLLFSLGICTCAALLFGLLPMTRLSSQLANQLRGGENGSIGGRSRNSMALISAEIAIAVVVVFMSSLVIRSFGKLLAVDPGFRTDHLVSAEISLPEPRFTESTPAADRVYEQVIAKLTESPGIEAAATTTVLPLRPSMVMSRFLVKGEQLPTSGAFPAAQIRSVSPSYFQTMGLSLQAGRIFNQKDVGAKPGSFIVNQAFASRYLTSRNPVGSTILMGVLTPKPDEVPVIGVVADAHDLGVDNDSEPEIYVPGFGLHSVLLVRSSAKTQDVESTIRAAVNSIIPGQPIFNTKTMTSVLAQSLARQQTTATLLGMFALAALLLAAVGIYGVLSYSVAQRTREIGVRMALGASRRQVVLLVLRQAADFLMGGVAAGLITSLGVAHFMSALLFQVHSVDPASFVLSIVSLILVALMAAVLPAIRAASASPREALRAE